MDTFTGWLYDAAVWTLRFTWRLAVWLLVMAVSTMLALFGAGNDW